MTKPATIVAPRSQGSVHLDALRGCAAMVVFLNHTRGLFFSSFLAPAQGQVAAALPVASTASAPPVDEIKVASAAVVVFFVLSGYLVGGSVIKSLNGHRWSWWSYLEKRLTRLMVVLVPAIVLGAALDYLGLHLFGPGSVYHAPPGLDLVISADIWERLKPAVLIGNMFFLQTIVVPVEGTNVSLWSLANEFWYYIAFPLAAIACYKQFAAWKRATSLIASLAVLWFTGPAIALLFPLWLMGTLVSVFPLRLEASLARRLSVLAAAALLAGIFATRLLHIDAVAAEYVIGVLTTLLLYTLVPQKVPSTARMYAAVADFFSKISYSLYCIHLPIAVFLCAAVNSPWKPHAKTPANLLLFALGDSLVLGLVFVFWSAFEANTYRLRILLVRET